MEKKKDSRPIILAAFALFAVVIVGVVLIGRSGGGDDDGGGDDPASVKKEIEERGKPKIKVPSGAPPKKLVSNDLVEGDGEEVKSGDEVTVQYVGVNFKT